MRNLFLRNTVGFVLMFTKLKFRKMQIIENDISRNKESRNEKGSEAFC